MGRHREKKRGEVGVRVNSREVGVRVNSNKSFQAPFYVCVHLFYFESERKIA